MGWESCGDFFSLAILLAPAPALSTCNLDMLYLGRKDLQYAWMTVLKLQILTTTYKCLRLSIMHSSCFWVFLWNERREKYPYQYWQLSLINHYIFGHLNDIIVVSLLDFSFQCLILSIFPARSYILRIFNFREYERAASGNE